MNRLKQAQFDTHGATQASELADLAARLNHVESALGGPLFTPLGNQGDDIRSDAFVLSSTSSVAAIPN